MSILSEKLQKLFPEKCKEEFEHNHTAIDEFTDHVAWCIGETGTSFLVEDDTLFYQWFQQCLEVRSYCLHHYGEHSVFKHLERFINQNINREEIERAQSDINQFTLPLSVILQHYAGFSFHETEPDLDIQDAPDGLIHTWKESSDTIEEQWLFKLIFTDPAVMGSTKTYIVNGSLNHYPYYVHDCLHQASQDNPADMIGQFYSDVSPDDKEAFAIRLHHALDLNDISKTTHYFSAHLNQALDMNKIPGELERRKAQVAEIFNIPIKTAAKWLKGAEVPSSSQIEVISQTLGVSSSWLSKSTGRPKIVANMFEVPIVTAERWLNGESLPTSSQMEIIAQTLQVDYKWFSNNRAFHLFNQLLPQIISYAEQQGETVTFNRATSTTLLNQQCKIQKNLLIQNDSPFFDISDISDEDEEVAAIMKNDHRDESSSTSPTNTSLTNSLSSFFQTFLHKQKITPFETLDISSSNEDSSLDLELHEKLSEESHSPIGFWPQRFRFHLFESTKITPSPLPTDNSGSLGK